MKTIGEISAAFSLLLGGKDGADMVQDAERKAGVTRRNRSPFDDGGRT